MLHRIIITILAIALVGCGSTSKVADTQLSQLNNGMSKLVQFGIIEYELADVVALRAAQKRSEQNNSGKDSLFSALTGDGSLVDGYLMSTIIGGGFSLGDFLSPTNIILSGLSVKKEWKDFERNVIFLEVGESCNEKCAISKLTEIAVKQRTLQYELLGIKLPNDMNVRNWEVGMWSKKRQNFYLNSNDGQKIILFSLRNPEFFNVNGKRYYGSNPQSDVPTDSRWRLGDNKEDYDIGLFSLIKVSEEHPELFSYFPKTKFQNSKYQNFKKQGCRGNFIVQNGKLELLYQMFGCLAFADETKAPADSLIVYQ